MSSRRKGVGERKASGEKKKGESRGEGERRGRKKEKSINNRTDIRDEKDGKVKENLNSSSQGGERIVVSTEKSRRKVTFQRMNMSTILRH